MLYELIKPYASVSIIGMCKNAGKTTVLNRLVCECNQHGECMGMTSIGRDGERSDLVTNTKKPEIFVWAGTLFATASGAIPLGTVSREILDVTPYSTPMGDVTLLRAMSDGFIQIAGPSIAAQLGRVRDMLFGFGAKRVLIDGALGRKSLAAPSVSDALILASGASYSPNMRKNALDTAYCAHIMSLRETTHSFSNVSAKFAVLSAGEALEFSELFAAIAALRRSAGEALLIRGGVTDSIACAILAGGRYAHEVDIVVEDGSKLLLSRANYDKLLLAGCNVSVTKPTRLLAITVNPFSAYGNHYDKNAFYDAVRKLVPPEVRVINIFEEEGKC